MKCIYCQGFSIKKGRSSTVQKYQCKACKKHFRSAYVRKAYTEQDEKNISSLNKEGMGISSIGRYLQIPKTSVQRLLERYASKIQKPIISEDRQSYDVDEIKTFIQNGNSECWVAYSINHQTGRVIDFVTGRRTIETIKPLIERIKLLNPKKIFTDRLNIYASLVDKTIHVTGKYYTWRIERSHLTLRDRLKRLSRETLCFSKSERMLSCCVKILLWG